jgi:hypothetical protein
MPTLLAVTVTEVGALPLDGFVLNQPESAEALQLMAPFAPLVTLMFWFAGARVVEPKKFNEAGVDCNTAATGETANVTGRLREEFWEPSATTVMVAL